MHRRNFLIAATATLVGTAIVQWKASTPTRSAAATGGPYTLPKLPYSEDALAPVISSTTVGLHYGKHHAGYVQKYNEAVAGTPFADLPIDQVLQQVVGDNSKAGIFNAGAQIWNHNFYWHSLQPQGGGKPQGKIKELIETSFGSYEKFREELAKQAVSLFGSGWTWLVHDHGKVAIVQTSNAATPLLQGQMPLLTIDVWEHAYYVDYQNRRKDYVDAVIDKLLNWSFANENLEKSMQT